MSARILGENPLYLPQAKVMMEQRLIGHVLGLPRNHAMDTRLNSIVVRQYCSRWKRGGQNERNFRSKLATPYREMSFPVVVYLMTGPGWLPPDSFTLDHERNVIDYCDQIGTLSNTVASRLKINKQ